MAEYFQWAQARISSVDWNATLLLIFAKLDVFASTELSWFFILAFALFYMQQLHENAFRSFSWLGHLGLSVLALSCGGVSASLVLAAKVGSFANPFWYPTLIVAWYLMSISFFNATVRTFKPLLVPIVAIFNANCLVSIITKVAAVYPTSFVAPILAGVFLVRSGTWITWALRVVSGDVKKEVSATAPEPFLRTVTYASVLYYFAADPSGHLYGVDTSLLIRPAYASVAMIALFIEDSIASDLFGRTDFTPFFPFEWFAWRVVSLFGLWPGRSVTLIATVGKKKRL